MMEISEQEIAPLLAFLAGKRIWMEETGGEWRTMVHGRLLLLRPVGQGYELWYYKREWLENIANEFIMSIVEGMNDG